MLRVHYEEVRRLIKEGDDGDCLEKALEKLEARHPSLTKEEAIVRLLLDLNRS